MVVSTIALAQNGYSEIEIVVEGDSAITTINRSYFKLDKAYYKLVWSRRSDVHRLTAYNQYIIYDQQGNPVEGMKGVKNNEGEFYLQMRSSGRQMRKRKYYKLKANWPNAIVPTIPNQGGKGPE